jgi:hypothetical protein
MLREYNEWLVEQCFADSDVLNMYDELPDDELDTFINNFSLKTKT